MKTSLAAVALFCLGLTVLTAAEFTVTNRNDSGGGSLRQAIINANTNGNVVPDTITLSFIPLPNGLPGRLDLLSALPPITSPVTIQSATPDLGAALDVRVVSTEHGIRVESDSVHLRHLGISGAGADKAQIIFSGVKGGSVQNCRLNDPTLIDPTGVMIPPNSGDGIRIARGGIIGANPPDTVLISQSLSGN